MNVFYFQVEEFSRELYKLNKTFTSKAKQKARDKEKDSVGGGPRRDMKSKDSSDELKEYSPLKLASIALGGVKNFQVRKIQF